MRLWIKIKGCCNEKNYFNSYDDTQFDILCIFRFKAPINEVPDYEIYHNGKLFETVPGDMLLNMYVENGGHVYEDCLNKETSKKEVNPLPTWYKKDVKKQTMSEEEVKELESMLSEFK